MTTNRQTSRQTSRQNSEHTTDNLNHNHPKSSKILQGALFGKTLHCWKLVRSTLQMGTITTWQEVQAISAKYERYGHVSKSALMDFGGFRKVPSQNT